MTTPGSIWCRSIDSGKAKARLDQAIGVFAPQQPPADSDGDNDHRRNDGAAIEAVGQTLPFRAQIITDRR